MEGYDFNVIPRSDLIAEALKNNQKLNVGKLEIPPSHTTIRLSFGCYQTGRWIGGEYRSSISNIGVEALPIELGFLVIDPDEGKRFPRVLQAVYDGNLQTILPANSNTTSTHLTGLLNPGSIDPNC